jgi:UDPglucose 6-dehydrogenase
MIGFAFKPNTGDIRGSIAYDNVQNLREYQPIIHVYDPLVDTTTPYLSDIVFEDNLKDAVSKCKYILIYSEKNEALLLDAEDYRNKVIFDGRNLLNKHLVKYAKHYKGVGK